MSNLDIIEATILQEAIKILTSKDVETGTIQALKDHFGDPEKIIQSQQTWNKRYAEEGHMWGDNPSICGQTLIQLLPEKSSVIDLGCGYGRDTIALLAANHRVVAIDNSQVAVNELEDEIEDYLNNGKAFALRGNFIHAPLMKEKFAGISSHRTMHLIKPNQMKRVMNSAASMLQDNGLLVMTARSIEDFNPKQMNKIDDLTAEYKNRPGHRLHFFNEERYDSILSKDFTNTQYEAIEEQECERNPIPTKLLKVVTRKKSETENSNIPPTEELEVG